jgi:hypothetical protein
MKTTVNQILRNALTRIALGQSGKALDLAIIASEALREHTKALETRFPVGLVFNRKRFPKAKTVTKYTIIDIYDTYDTAGNLVGREYLVTHDFLGCPVPEKMCDTTIARAVFDNPDLQHLITKLTS